MEGEMTREKGRERLDTDTSSLYGHRVSLSLALYLSLSVTVCLSSTSVIVLHRSIGSVMLATRMHTRA
jgi:hypothetical protein